jgi:hypothetical protein
MLACEPVRSRVGGPGARRIEPDPEGAETASNQTHKPFEILLESAT